MPYILYVWIPYFHLFSSAGAACSELIKFQSAAFITDELKRTFAIEEHCIPNIKLDSSIWEEAKSIMEYLDEIVIYTYNKNSWSLDVLL